VLLPSLQTAIHKRFLDRKQNIVAQHAPLQRFSQGFGHLLHGQGQVLLSLLILRESKGLIASMQQYRSHGPLKNGLGRYTLSCLTTFQLTHALNLQAQYGCLCVSFFHAQSLGTVRAFVNEAGTIMNMI
jgi:hypothetical protein